MPLMVLCSFQLFQFINKHKKNMKNAQNALSANTLLRKKLPFLPFLLVFFQDFYLASDLRPNLGSMSPT